MTRLDKKVVIVTGAGGGIGAACARILAANGAKVIATDINEENVKKVVTTIRLSGGLAIGLKHDVTKVADWELAVKKAHEFFGKVNVLVNNAGIPSETPAELVSDEEWHRVMDINTLSIHYGVNSVIADMRQAQHGSIINISSMAGLIGNCGSGPYTASKGAVTALTKALAHDYAADSIRANSLHPGFIETPMSSTHFNNPEAYAYLNSLTPLPYLGQPEDVAYAVVFLASEESKFITGTHLPIDGGIVAG